MPLPFEDPNHWRGRAEEARAIADDIQDPESRRLMLNIALGYDQMAARATARPKPKS